MADRLQLHERIWMVERRLAVLETRPAVPGEGQLPVDVEDRCRRARKALRSAEVALRPVFRKDWARAEQQIAAAEHEADLGEQLAKELALQIARDGQIARRRR